MNDSDFLPGIGRVTIRSIGEDVPRLQSPSLYEEWGEMVWYGPTITSKALNIGISLVEDFRGKGIGVIAQRLLAEELHRLGFARVEAQTDVQNIPEQKALKKAGFLFEGVARHAQGRADGIHDLQVWSHISI